MIGQATLLVTRVRLVDRAPAPRPPAKRGRGRPATYPDRLCLKALVVTIVRRLHTPHALLAALPAEVRFVLGDRHYNPDEVRAACDRADCTLVAAQHGAYPHTDDGVEVRRVFPTLRSASIANFNGQFQAMLDLHGAVPTKGPANTRRFALGAVLVYQLTLWHRHEEGLARRVGLDPFPKAA